MARQAVIDKGTGFYNRRFFMEALEREMSRTRRHGPGMVVALCEPHQNLDDHSKPENPHDSAALSMLGRLLTRELRRSDIICRYGSSTLAVLFPQTHPKGLKGRLEYLRHRIGRHRFAYKGNPVRLGVDIGICILDLSGTESAAELMSRAQAALVIAKQRGNVHAIGMD
jgi:two-component system cell cycle response regulator